MVRICNYTLFAISTLPNHLCLAVRCMSLWMKHRVLNFNLQCSNILIQYIHFYTKCLRIENIHKNSRFRHNNAIGFELLLEEIRHFSLSVWLIYKTNPSYGSVWIWIFINTFAVMPVHLISRYNSATARINKVTMQWYATREGHQFSRNWVHL